MGPSEFRAYEQKAHSTWKQKPGEVLEQAPQPYIHHYIPSPGIFFLDHPFTMKAAGKQARQAGRQAGQASQPASKQASQARKQASNWAT